MKLADCIPLLNIRAPNVMWFLGAGASAASGIPTAGHMTLDFKRTLYCMGERVRIEQCSDLGDPVLLRRIQMFLDASGRFPAEGDVEEYARYFEAVYPTESDRRRYIDSLIAGGTPSFGHQVLSVLMALDRVRTVWTTNFDAMVEDSAAEVLRDRRRLNVATLDSAQLAIDCLNEGRAPLLVKLHGDYRSRRLKNTTEELRRQDETLRYALTDSCRRLGLAVVGYSGRDDSVMAALREAFASGRGFPSGLFWFHRPAAGPLPAVHALLNEARSLGVDAHLVEVDTFDEVMQDQLLLLRDVPDELAGRLRSPARRSTPAPIPSTDGAFPVLRMNALPVVSAPTTCRLVECEIGGAKAVREAVAEMGFVVCAGRRRAGVIAFGSNTSVRATFDAFRISKFDIHAIDSKRLRHESAEKGLLHDALTVALARGRPLIIERKGRARLLRVDPARADDDMLSKLRRLVGKLHGTVVGVDIAWSEAAAVRLMWHIDRLWAILQPVVWLDVDRDAPDRAQAAEFARERLARRYNRERNDILDAWLHVFFGSATAGNFHAFGVGDDGVDAEFRLLRRTAYSRRSR